MGEGGQTRNSWIWIKLEEKEKGLDSPNCITESYLRMVFSGVEVADILDAIGVEVREHNYANYMH